MSNVTTPDSSFLSEKAKPSESTSKAKKITPSKEGLPNSALGSSSLENSSNSLTDMSSVISQSTTNALANLVAYMFPNPDLDKIPGSDTMFLKTNDNKDITLQHYCIEALTGNVIPLKKPTSLVDKSKEDELKVLGKYESDHFDQTTIDAIAKILLELNFIKENETLDATKKMMELVNENCHMNVTALNDRIKEQLCPNWPSDKYALTMDIVEIAATIKAHSLSSNN